MGFLEVITILFIVLKVFGVVAWSWWIVFSPLLAAIGIYLLIFLVVLTGGFVVSRKTKNGLSKWK